jgi:hypothetical protein
MLWKSSLIGLIPKITMDFQDLGTLYSLVTISKIQEGIWSNQVSSQKETDTVLAIAAKRAVSNLSKRFKQCWKMPRKDCSTKAHFWNIEWHAFHTYLAAGQNQIAWAVDSSSRLHQGHLPSSVTLHLIRFSLVGRMSLHARHMNILTEFGIRRFQRELQTTETFLAFRIDLDPFPRFLNINGKHF